MGGDERQNDRATISGLGSDVQNPTTGLTDATLEEVQQTRERTGEAETTDLQIVADATRPTTKQEMLQEFVDDFGQVGGLYSNSVDDPARLAKFQERMANLYMSDYATFKELAAVGKSITTVPPASPDNVGKALAQVFRNTLERQGGTIDLSSEEMMNLQGAMAGMMLAARGTFAPVGTPEQTVKMVDALDNELRRLNVPFVHAIIWGDTKEPGLAVVPPGKTINRHNFEG